MDIDKAIEEAKKSISKKIDALDELGEIEIDKNGNYIVPQVVFEKWQDFTEDLIRETVSIIVREGHRQVTSYAYTGRYLARL